MFILRRQTFGRNETDTNRERIEGAFILCSSIDGKGIKKKEMEVGAVLGGSRKKRLENYYHGMVTMILRYYCAGSQAIDAGSRSEKNEWREK